MMHDVQKLLDDFYNSDEGKKHLEKQNHKYIRQHKLIEFAYNLPIDKKIELCKKIQKRRQTSKFILNLVWRYGENYGEDLTTEFITLGCCSIIYHLEDIDYYICIMNDNGTTVNLFDKDTFNDWIEHIKEIYSIRLNE